MKVQHSGVRLKALLARLDPKPAALARIRQTAGSRRYVYNRLLAERHAAWKALGESPDSEIRKAFGREWSYVGMTKRITLWRSELPWLRACPVHALQNAALDLESAFLN